MYRKSFSLVSKGLKILSSFLTIVFIALTVVLICYEALWYAIVFSSLVLALCLFATVMTFRNRIVVDKKQGLLIVNSLKNISINLNDLQNVHVDINNSVNKNKYCFIVFKFINGQEYKISEYSTIYNHKSVHYTQKLVHELNEYLNYNYEQYLNN